jgi:hypothetical protein
MVQQAITRLEDAVKNVSLLSPDGKPPQQVQEEREQYFRRVFNGLLGLYVGINLPTVRSAAVDGVSLPEQDENHAISFSALLAYIPRIDDEAYIRDAIFSDAPVLAPLQDVNIEQRMQEMTRHTHDGAIIWDERYVDTAYMAIGDIWVRAIAAANAVTGNDARALDTAIAPLIPWPIKTEQTRQRLVGLKTINGACVPLAIPGAVSYVLRSTVHRFGIGKVLMFDGKGLSMEGYVERVPGLPDKELYLLPEQEVAIVKNVYSFDPELRKVKFWTHSHMHPKKLGLPPVQA